MRTEVERLDREIHHRLSEWTAKVFPRRDLPMDPELLILVLRGLADGLTFLRLLTPGLITDKVIVATFHATAAGR